MSFRKTRLLLLRAAILPILSLALFVRFEWSDNLAFGIELSGYAFLLLGLLMRIWSILYIGGRKSQELVRTGPYSICRNPLYVGTLLLALGVGLCFENPLVLAATVLLLLPVHVIVARMEAKHLRAIFPGEYDAYAREVPAFWPRWSGYRSPEYIEVSPRSIRRVAVDTLGVLLIPEIEDLPEILHHAGIIPVLFQFKM